MSPSRSTAALLLLSAIGFCQALTALSHGIIPSPQATDNPFDGGALGSCEVPATNTCTVGYPVPTSIARLAEIIEQSIMIEAGHLEGECSDAYRTVLCNIRFPRCTNLVRDSLYQQVVLNQQNCSVLQSSCSSEIAPAVVGFCNNLVHATVPINECRPVSELARNASRELRFCDIKNMAFSITGWMFEYMVFLDAQFMGLLYNNEQCGPDLATFMCNFGGRCTENGERIQYINTHEICNDRINCYGDDVQRHAADELSCELWPQQHLGTPTYTGPTLPTGTTTDNSSATDNLTNRATGIVLEANSASSLRQYTSWIVISMLVLLCSFVL